MGQNGANAIGAGTGALWGYLRFDDKNNSGAIERDIPPMGCNEGVREGYLAEANLDGDDRITEIESWRYAAGFSIDATVAMREVFLAGLQNVDGEVRKVAAGELCQIMVASRLDALLEEAQAGISKERERWFFSEVSDVAALLVRLGDVEIKEEIKEKLRALVPFYTDKLSMVVADTFSSVEQNRLPYALGLAHLGVVLDDATLMSNAQAWIAEGDESSLRYFCDRVTGWKVAKAGAQNDEGLLLEAFEAVEEMRQGSPATNVSWQIRDTWVYKARLESMLKEAVAQKKQDKIVEARAFVEQCVADGVFLSGGVEEQLQVYEAEAQIAGQNHIALATLVNDVDSIDIRQAGERAYIAKSRILSKIAVAMARAGASIEVVGAVLIKARDCVMWGATVSDPLGVKLQTGSSLTLDFAAPTEAMQEYYLAMVEAGILLHNANLVALGVRDLGSKGLLLGYAKAAVELSKTSDQVALLGPETTALDLLNTVVDIISPDNASFVNALEEVGSEYWLSELINTISQARVSPEDKLVLLNALDEHLVALRDKFFNEGRTDKANDMEMRRVQLALIKLAQGIDIENAAALVASSINDVMGNLETGEEPIPYRTRGANSTFWQATTYMVGSYGRGDSEIIPVYMGMD